MGAYASSESPAWAELLVSPPSSSYVVPETWRIRPANVARLTPLDKTSLSAYRVSRGTERKTSCLWAPTVLSVSGSNSTSEGNEVAGELVDVDARVVAKLCSGRRPSLDA